MKLHLFIRQLIRLSLAVGLLAVFLASSPAQAQEPPGSQGLWQTFTTANSGLRDNHVTALLEDRDGGLWIATHGGVNCDFNCWAKGFPDALVCHKRAIRTR